MTEPSVSVLMPVHNCAGYVAEALRSVLRQTMQNFECLVIDDGSTDETAAVCCAVAGDDPRVRLIRKPNTGLVDTLNVLAVFLASIAPSSQELEPPANPARLNEGELSQACNPTGLRHADEPQIDAVGEHAGEERCAEPEPWAACG